MNDKKLTQNVPVHNKPATGYIALNADVAALKTKCATLEQNVSTLFKIVEELKSSKPQSSNDNHSVLYELYHGR